MEFFSDGSEYMGDDTRPDPPGLEIEDPDAAMLSPEIEPEYPAMMDQIDSTMPEDTEEQIDYNPEMAPEMTEAIEPFVGDEYQPF